MGAGELLIIAVIGLVVLGPERLPVAIRTVSGWIRSAKQMANGLTQEINHELKVQELHQNLKKAEEQGLENLSPELSQTVQELKDAAASVTRPYEATHTSDDEHLQQQHWYEPEDNSIANPQAVNSEKPQPQVAGPQKPQVLEPQFGPQSEPQPDPQLKAPHSSTEQQKS